MQCFRRPVCIPKLKVNECNGNEGSTAWDLSPAQSPEVKASVGTSRQKAPCRHDAFSRQAAAACPFYVTLGRVNGPPRISTTRQRRGSADAVAPSNWVVTASSAIFRPMSSATLVEKR